MSVMQEIYGQPFLISLKMANKQTENYVKYSALLLKQQVEFKEYLYERCLSNKQIHKDFGFLKMVDSELSNICFHFAGQVKEVNNDFHCCWSNLINDTHRFISYCIDVLNFTVKCPEFLINEPVQIISEYKWINARIDLSEVLTGIHLSGAVLQKDGLQPPYAKFANSFGGLFGISYPNAESDFDAVITRKRSRTKFMNLMTERIDDAYEKKYSKKN